MFYESEDDNGGSSLTESIINAVSSIGTAAIISSESPRLGTPYPQPTTSFGYSPQNYGKANGNSMLVIIVLIIAGVFAFTKLK